MRQVPDCPEQEGGSQPLALSLKCSQVSPGNDTPYAMSKAFLTEGHQNLCLLQGITVLGTTGSPQRLESATIPPKAAPEVRAATESKRALHCARYSPVGFPGRHSRPFSGSFFALPFPYPKIQSVFCSPR